MLLFLVLLFPAVVAVIVVVVVTVVIAAVAVVSVVVVVVFAAVYVEVVVDGRRSTHGHSLEYTGSRRSTHGDSFEDCSFEHLGHSFESRWNSALLRMSTDAIFF